MKHLFLAQLAGGVEHRLYLCKEIIPTTCNECPVYDIKQFSSAIGLGNAENPFTAITSRFTLAWSESI